MLTVLLAATLLAGCTTESGLDPDFGEVEFEAPETGRTGSSGTQFDDGVPRVEAHVDADQLGADETLTIRWLVDGVEIASRVRTAQEVAGDDPWEGGASVSMTFWLEASPGGLPPGTYSFQLEHGGEVVAEASFVVGSGHGVGPITVTDEVDPETGEPLGLTRDFVEGEERLYAVFRAPSPGGDGRLEIEWTIQGVVVRTETFSAADARLVAGNPMSRIYDSFTWQGGVPPGHYNVTLTPAIGGERTASFVVGGGSGIGSVVFGDDNDGVLIRNVTDTFDRTTPTIHAGYDVVGYPADTKVVEEWIHDGEVVWETNFTLGEITPQPYQPMVSRHTWLSADEGWPLGEYHLDLSLDGTFVKSGSFRVVS